MTGVVVELCSKLHTESESSLSGHNGYLVRGVLSSEFEVCPYRDVLLQVQCIYIYRIHSTSCSYLRCLGVSGD